MFVQVNQLAKIHDIEGVLFIISMACYVHLPLKDILNCEMTWEHFHNCAILCCELFHLSSDNKSIKYNAHGMDENTNRDYGNHKGYGDIQTQAIILTTL